MLKCVFVVEIWPFKSGPRCQKWGKNGGNGGGEMGQNPQFPTTVNVCATFCGRTSQDSIWISMTGADGCGDKEMSVSMIGVWQSTTDIVGDQCSYGLAYPLMDVRTYTSLETGP